MKKRDKINLAVIYYGNKKQLVTNNKQFTDLKRLLTNFNLLKYDFNNGEGSQLIDDFKNDKIDIVLKNSFGRGNENHIEKFLEKNKIPFMGSDSKTTLIGTSKLLSKKVFIRNKLPVAKDIFVNDIKWKKSKSKILEKTDKYIHYPCIVKDVGGTDSRGLYFTENKGQCISAINKIINNNHDLIIEEYIKADNEITCMVIGNKKLTAYTPVSVGNCGTDVLLSGNTKDNNLFTMKIPASLPKAIINKVKSVSIKAHKALGCRTFSRADILITNNRLFLLEVDVHPGFRSKSPTLLSAKYQNESPDELFLKFFDLSKNK